DRTAVQDHRVAGQDAVPAVSVAQEDDAALRTTLRRRTDHGVQTRTVTAARQDTQPSLLPAHRPPPWKSRPDTMPRATRAPDSSRGRHDPAESMPPLPADAEGNGPRGHADGNGWKAPAGELRRLERAGRSRERQDQGDGQPGARAGAQLDPPTVRLDDLARDREAEPERPGLRRHE